jgi:prepilin-type N-terminal cleavage/methylation domain-containing protein
MLYRKLRHKAFTLIELIVAFVILSLIVPTLYRWGASLYNAAASGTAQTALRSEGIHGLNILKSDLSQATTCNNVGGTFTAISTTSVSFYIYSSTLDPNLVTWSFTGSNPTQLLRTLTPTSGVSCTPNPAQSTTQTIFANVASTTLSSNFGAYLNGSLLNYGPTCLDVNTSCSPDLLNIYTTIISSGTGSPTDEINLDLAVGNG